MPARAQQVAAVPDTAPENLADALAAFQMSLPHVGKDNVGVIPGKDGRQGYKYEYADLTAISAAVLPLLGRVGLSWSAKPTVNEHGHFVLEYRLRHRSGEEDIGSYPLPDPTRSTAQQIGSAVTYARRYALCSVTGIAPGGEDDDAAAGNDAPAGTYSRPTPPQHQPQRGDNGNGGGHGDGGERAPSGGPDPSRTARNGAVALLDAPTQARADEGAAWVGRSGVGDQDVTAALTEEDRTTLGIDDGDSVDLVDLATYVTAYWGKHGHGPRQDPQDAVA